MNFTLRQYYAAHALASLTAAPDYSKGPCNASIAERAFAIADTMIREEAQTGTEQAAIREIINRCNVQENAIRQAISMLLTAPVRRVDNWEQCLYAGLSKANAVRFSQTTADALTALQGGNPKDTENDR